MGSPVTLSGFNNIDFNVILNAVMAQERAPLTRLETQKKTLESQNTAFSTLNGKLSTLQSAVDALKESDSLSLVSATSSDSGVEISTTSGTVAGSYEVVVSELARKQVTVSTTTYGSLDTVVADGGSLVLHGPDGDRTFTATAGMTLQDLVDAINDDDDSPATASVVQSAPGQFRLVLTGVETGADNAFTITSSFTVGHADLDFEDFDNDGLSGEDDDDNAISAIDAALTVNNIPITSTTNTVENVIPGVTLTLKKKDPDTTVTIEVQKDAAAAKKLVEKFASAYNDLVTFAKDQNTAAVAGKASIGRDPVLQALRSSLGQALRDEYTEGGSLTRLAAIGLGFDVSGKLTLDSDMFEDAFDNSPADLQKLFSDTGGAGGAFGEIDALLDKYTEAGGFIDDVTAQNTAHVTALSNRLAALESQLALKRTALQKEFTAADLAMNRLNSQSSSLAGLGGGYRLF